jgi:hypothetical protein
MNTVKHLEGLAGIKLLIFLDKIFKNKKYKKHGGGVSPEFVYRLQKDKNFVYNCIKLQSTECMKCIPMTGNIPYQYLLYGKLTWKLLNTIRTIRMKP